jgi:5'-deoxynucleotidase YfbR-like HD superfamily hydrolase
LEQPANTNKPETLVYPHKRNFSMKNIANLLFKANILKKIPRSGYHFLGAGKESVAEHSFSTAFIAFVMAQMIPDANAYRLIAMCLVHDLPEAKTGDLNYVQKKYVTANENKAIEHIVNRLPFGENLSDLISEFNERQTIESKLAHDADQLSLILDLKTLSDIGYEPPKKWLRFALNRLETKIGQEMARSIMETEWDAWWLENFIDSPNKKE